MSSRDSILLPEGWTCLQDSSSVGPLPQVVHARSPEGTEAAVKLLAAESRLAAAREASLLEAVAHPGIARLLAHGEEPTPWLATAWIDGEPWPGSADPAALLAQLLGALAHLHGRGLVHGDLRPENVLVRPDGTLVLVDLGLGATWRRSARVGAEGGSGEPATVAGTPAYLAPERIAGGTPSPAADAWSAAAMTLELLAGPAAVTTARGGELPELPASLEILAALLRLEADARPTASEALRELLPATRDLPEPLRRRLAVDAEARPVDATPEPGRPALVGRHSVLERLDRVLATTREGAGTFVVVTAEPGLGRTRLVEELGARARAEGVRFLAGRCRESDSGGPGPFREALLELAHDLARRKAAEVAELVTPEARALGYACPEMLDLPYVRSLPEPDDLSPDLNKFRVFAAVTGLLRNWSRREPVVLALDDMQWADQATLELVYYLQRNVVHAATTFGEAGAGGALSIVITCRQDAGSELLAKTVADARRGGAHLEVELQRLLPDQVGELVAAMLPGAAPPEDLVELVAAESGGVPQLAVALVASLHAEGLIQLSDGRWRFSGTLGNAAGMLGEVLGRRIARVGDDARELLLAAAVLGRDFDPGVAAEIAGLDGKALDRVLVELREARLIQPAASGRESFAHDQARRLTLDELEAGQRAERHLAAARALETRHGDGAGPASTEIARHHVAAGSVDGALRWLPRAAAELRLAGSWTEALDLLRRQVELIEGLPRAQRRERATEALAARQALAEILARSDRWHEATDAFLDLLGACRGASDPLAEARALVGLGMTENLAGRYAEAGEHLERALELARRAQAPPEIATSRLYLLQNAYMRGRLDAAAELEDSVLEAARNVGDRAVEAEALRQVGLSHHFRGRTDEAIALYREALRLLEAVGDRRNTAATLHNLGILHNARGEYHVAMDYYERSLAIFRELGRRHDTASCLTNIGNVHLQQGAPREAERRYLEAQSIHRELADRRGAADNLSNLAEVDATLGRHARARERYRQALSVHRDMGNRARIAFAAGNLATALLHLGQLDEASTLAEEALAIDRELDAARELAYDLELSARLLQLRGRDEDAVAEYRLALEQARGGGDRFHAAHLLARLSELLLGLDRPDEAREVAEDAFAEATSLGARDAEAVALAALAATGAGPSASERLDRAAELAERLENPEVALRAFRLIARVKVERGDATGAALALDRAVEAVAAVARGLGDEAHGFLARRDVRTVLDDLLELEESSERPRVDALLDTWHLLVHDDARSRAKRLVSSRLGGGAADVAELRRLRVFRELVSTADLQSLDGLLSAFLGRLLDLVDAERGLLFLLRGSELTCRLAIARDGAPLVAAERSAPRQALEWVLRRREGLITEDASVDDRLEYRESVADLRVRSLLAAPLLDGDELLGVVYADRRTRGGRFSDEARADFEATCADLGRLAANARRAEEREAEVRRLRDRAAALPTGSGDDGLPGLLGESEPMRQLFASARLAARSGENVLVTGESGTGKEGLARALHACSPRSGRAFVALDCGAVPETLMESVLFGHVKGAFTGADRDRPGIFEEADGGTLFLDEITNATREFQARLLRVLQEREVRRVGGRGTVPVDVRVVVATNRDLAAEVAAGQFREDLYYRLAVIPLHLPPLRERGDDVALLAEHFLAQVAERDGKDLQGFTEEALRRLAAHGWPGNVRELGNVVARMAAFCAGGRVGADRVPESVGARSSDTVRVDLQRDAAEEAVERMSRGEDDFWAVVREPLRARTITREQARSIVAEGLRRTRGSYKRTAELFGLAEGEYGRFMDYLRFNELKLDFRPFRRSGGPAKA